MASNSDQISNGLARRLLAGALAGMIAAVPMALVMDGLNKVIPARRNAVLIASHLVWGSLIGLLANRIIQQSDRLA